nr:psi-producing oxygenase a [Quercus suber]
MRLDVSIMEITQDTRHHRISNHLQYAHERQPSPPVKANGGSLPHSPSEVTEYLASYVAKDFDHSEKEKAGQARLVKATDEARSESSETSLVKASQHRRGGPNGVTPMPAGLSKLDEFRANIRSALKNLTGLGNAIKAPLPTQTGDGTALPPPERHDQIEAIESFWRDMNALGITRIDDLLKMAEKTKNHEPLDDKKYGMEHLIQAAAILPDDDISKKLTGGLLTQLWKDLDHPPQTLLDDGHHFRQPDGRGNNYQLPHLGAAGMPYARTVAPQKMQSGAMPDPGVLFDTVMARKNNTGLEHPNKISSILFNFASIIIHDVFKTNRTDYNISDTSSYLDLAPLYGSTWPEQKRMRTFKDGKIKPDCFAETRLLTFPPGVGAILIMFNRYHNYVVEQLALINEEGRFTENPKKVKVERYGEKINKRDDDLFQTARLITCALYCNIILVSVRLP